MSSDIEIDMPHELMAQDYFLRFGGARYFWRDLASRLIAVILSNSWCRISSLRMSFDRLISAIAMSSLPRFIAYRWLRHGRPITLAFDAIIYIMPAAVRLRMLTENAHFNNKHHFCRPAAVSLDIDKYILALS